MRPGFSPPARLARMSEEDGPRTTPWAPWVRGVALLLVVALVGLYVASLF